MLKEIIIDAITGEETIIEYTPAELKEKKKQDAEAIALFEAEIEAKNAKESARQSALEKLAALGLTEDEIAALAG